MFLSVTHEKRGTPVADSVRVADTWKARLIGLLWTATLSPQEGLWISPCTSVHTFFMRYPIDVIFLDSDHRVLHASTLVPWRISRWIPKAMGVLELSAGQIQKTQIRFGDRLRFEERG